MKKPTPIAEHVAEPFGRDISPMVRCSDCIGADGRNGSYRCGSFVPSMANQPIHCRKFRPKRRAS